jgi:hypothetical protein
MCDDGSHADAAAQLLSTGLDSLEDVNTRGRVCHAQQTQLRAVVLVPPHLEPARSIQQFD